MKNLERPDGWEANRRDQLRHWMSLTAAQRLAALEELNEFIRQYSGLAGRRYRRGARDADAS